MPRAKSRSPLPDPNRDTLEQELAEERKTAEVAEGCGGLMHDLGNLANSLVLETRALERQVPESWRQQIADLRQLGMEMASVMQRFQQFRQRRKTPPYAVDLNQAVRAAIDSQFHPSPKLELASALPPVLATVTDCQRLVRLLLAHVEAVSSAALTVRTKAKDDKVWLEITAEGNPDATKTEADSLEWAACETLVRRLGGILRRQQTSAASLEIRVALPIYPD